MINDLPSNAEAFGELNIDCLDPVLKDYVFSSFFLTRLVEKTMREKNELEKENIRLKAQLEEYAVLREKFNEIKATIDKLGSLAPSEMKFESNDSSASIFENSPEFQDEGFIKRNRDNLEKIANADDAVATEMPSLEVETLAIDDSVNETEVTFETEIHEEGLTENLEEPVETSAEEIAAALADIEALSSEAEPASEASAEEIAAALAELESVETEVTSIDEVVEEPSADELAAALAELGEMTGDVVEEAVIEPIAAEAEPVTEPEPEPEPVPVPEPAPAQTPEPIIEAVEETPVEIAEPVPAEVVEPTPVIEEPASEPVIEEAAPVPAPEPAPAAPKVEIPSDPNAALTPEQIAALFAGV